MKLKIILKRNEEVYLANISTDSTACEGINEDFLKKAIELFVYFSFF